MLFLIATTRVFYNPDNKGEITVLGQIWIYKVICMWAAIIGIGAFPVFILFYWFVVIEDQMGSSHSTRIIRHGWCFLIIYATLSLIGMFCLFSIGAVFALPLIEIIFFSPFAFFAYQAAHDKYVRRYKSIFVKKVFDFVLNNDTLYTDLVKQKLNNRPITSKRIKRDEMKKNMIESYGEEQVPADVADFKNEEFDISEMVGVNFELSSNKILSKYKMNHRILLSKEEKLFRLTFMNYCFIKFYAFVDDMKLIAFLENKENMETEWQHVTLNQLAQYCAKGPNKANMWKGSLSLFFLLFMFVVWM